MSQVPAKMSTTPAQRSCPNAASPAARNVSASPTTVTWFGVSGVRPSAVIKASAWRRTHASNRVVNTSHLHRLRGLGGCGEAVDAAGEVPPVLLPCRGPLVLDEGRLDLAVGHEQSGRVEAREVLARALEPRPE